MKFQNTTSTAVCPNRISMKLLGVGPDICRTCGGSFTRHKAGRGWFCSVECRGRAKFRPAIERFWEKVSPEPMSGCWLWTGADYGKGYGSFYDGHNIRSAHIFSYEHYVGAVPDGLILRHRCDLPPCVNPDHLVPGTQLQNMQDAVLRGRHPIGSKCRNSKLTEEIILDARIRNLTTAQFATEQDVSKSTASTALRGIKWRHV